MFKLITNGPVTVDSGTSPNYQVSGQLIVTGGFSPSEIVAGYRLFDAAGSLYEITNVIATDNFASTFTVDITEITNAIVTTSVPPIASAQSIIYNPGTSEGIPEIFFNVDSSANADILASIASYNAQIDELIPLGSGEVVSYTPGDSYPSKALVNVEGVIYTNISGDNNSNLIPGTGWERVAAPNSLYPTTFKTTADGWGSSVRTSNLTDNLSTKDMSGAIGTPPAGETFMGGCSDGLHVYLAPQNSTFFVRINIVTDEIETLVAPYPRVTNANLFTDKFNGAVFDGEFIWMIPSWAAPMVKINRDTFTVAEIFPNFNVTGDDAYNGGLALPQFNKIYACPHHANTLKWVDIQTSTTGTTSLTGLTDISLGSRAFLNMVFDGTSVWLLPRRSNKIVEINPDTGAILSESEHPASLGVGNQGPNVGYFHGGSFDGRYIWMSPYNTSLLCWFDTIDKVWFSTPHNASTTTQPFIGSAIVDGYIMFPAFNATETLLVNPRTQELRYINRGTAQGDPSFIVPTDDKLYFFPSQSTTYYTKSLGFTDKTIQKLQADEIVIHGSSAGTISSLDYTYDGAPATLTDPDIENYYNDVGFTFEGSERVDISPNTLDLSNGGTIYLQYSGDAGSETNPRIFNTASAFTTSDGCSFYIAQGSSQFVFAAGGNAQGSGSNTLPTGAGVHKVAVTFDAAGLITSLDGSLLTGSSADFTTASQPNDPVIGNFIYGGFDRPFDRTMLEIAVFETKLTAAELNALTGVGNGDFSAAKTFINFRSITASSATGRGLNIKGGIVDQEGSSGTLGQVLVRNSNGGLSYGGNDIDLGTNKVINLGAPSSNDDATTKAYVDDLTQYLTSGVGSPEGFISAPVGTLYVDTAGTENNVLYIKESTAGTTGWNNITSKNWSRNAAVQNVNAGAFKLTNLANPTNDQDAATKAYVDSEITSNSPIILTGTTTVDLPILTPGNGVSTSITVTGAVVGDVTSPGMPSNIPPYIVVKALVNTADTVLLQMYNAGTVDYDPSNFVYNVKVFK